MSGWWPSASAMSAACATKPNASRKSGNENSRRRDRFPSRSQSGMSDDIAAASAEEPLAAVRLAGCKPGAFILDAGCGNGRHAVPLARAGYRVVAFDRSAPLLAAGRRSAGGARWPIFVRGCYSSLPFGTWRFDAVLSLGTALGYLGDAGDQRALCEFRRVLIPGGRLVIETLHREQLDAGFAVHEDRELPGGGTLRSDRSFDPARGILHEAQRLRDDAGWGPARAYDIRVYGIDELGSM